MDGTGNTRDSTTRLTRLSLDQLRSAVEDISKALNEALRDDRSNAAMYLRRAEGVLRARMTDAPAAANPGPVLIAWKKRRILDYIDSHLASTLRNKQLADVVEYSEFHFNVAFRNTLGASPREYIIRRRIDRAQQLMVSTSMSLCEIASECGLADQAHLSRLFRKIVGESPAAWRRSHMAPDES